MTVIQMAVADMLVKVFIRKVKAEPMAAAAMPMPMNAFALLPPSLPSFAGAAAGAGAGAGAAAAAAPGVIALLKLLCRFFSAEPDHSVILPSTMPQRRPNGASRASLTQTGFSTMFTMVASQSLPSLS